MNIPGFGTKKSRGVRAGIIAFSLCAIPALAQSVPDAGEHSASTAAQASPAREPMKKKSPYHPVSVPGSAMSFYRSAWGIDSLQVRRTDSGHLIRFTYKVTDPVRAKALGEERSEPALVDMKRGVSLKIPSLENIGDLRQKGKPVAGKQYWMVFSNKGNKVKGGDRVSVVIGSFHADGLLVE